MLRRNPPATNLTSEPSILPTNPPGGFFATTHWTRVVEARGHSPEAKAALSDLCAAYYAPVFAFIRWHAPDQDAARELTQEFFARLLARESLGSVDPRRGRFRSYLLGAVKHFLADARDHAQRLKRHAAQPVESIEAGMNTSTAVQLRDTKTLSPDREFDRKWALTVLDRALAGLAEEHKAAGNSEQFETLKPWLTGDAEGLSQADAARRLGLNAGALKVAIHRPSPPLPRVGQSRACPYAPSPISSSGRTLLPALRLERKIAQAGLLWGVPPGQRHKFVSQTPTTKPRWRLTG
jgi:RNA polymerase sigma-70 factor (ECF subfamily)